MLMIAYVNSVNMVTSSATAFSAVPPPAWRLPQNRMPAEIRSVRHIAGIGSLFLPRPQAKKFSGWKIRSAANA